jgi:hypothetical protein
MAPNVTSASRDRGASVIEWTRPSLHAFIMVYSAKDAQRNNAPFALTPIVGELPAPTQNSSGLFSGGGGGGNWSSGVFSPALGAAVRCRAKVVAADGAAIREAPVVVAKPPLSHQDAQISCACEAEHADAGRCRQPEINHGLCMLLLCRGWCATERWENRVNNPGPMVHLDKARISTKDASKREYRRYRQDCTQGKVIRNRARAFERPTEKTPHGRG